MTPGEPNSAFILLTLPRLCLQLFMLIGAKFEPFILLNPIKGILPFFLLIGFFFLVCKALNNFAIWLQEKPMMWQSIKTG